MIETMAEMMRPAKTAALVLSLPVVVRVKRARVGQQAEVHEPRSDSFHASPIDVKVTSEGALYRLVTGGRWKAECQREKGWKETGEKTRHQLFFTFGIFDFPFRGQLKFFNQCGNGFGAGDWPWSRENLQKSC